MYAAPVLFEQYRITDNCTYLAMGPDENDPGGFDCVRLLFAGDTECCSKQMRYWNSLHLQLCVRRQMSLTVERRWPSGTVDVLLYRTCQ